VKPRFVGSLNATGRLALLWQRHSAHRFCESRPDGTYTGIGAPVCVNGPKKTMVVVQSINGSYGRNRIIVLLVARRCDSDL
jgi:hypothetical protein